MVNKNPHKPHMKKLFLTSLIAGIFIETAFAQPNVTINGQFDNSIIKETGSDTRMWRNHDDLIRFKGSEDLGNGTQAVFNLEHRLNPDGTRCSGNNAIDKLHGTPGVDWQGAANIGLKNAEIGTLLLGRTSSISIDNFYQVDPFVYDGIAASTGAFDITYSGQISNSIRYDSPKWHGFTFSGSYSVGKDTHKTDTPDGNAIDYHAYGNDGFALGATYENGGLLLIADYERVQDSDKSWSWNIGALYRYEGFTFSTGYHASTIKQAAVNRLIHDDHALKQRSMIAAVNYDNGPHTYKLAYSRGILKSDGNYDGYANKYSVGYVYSLSKRTSLYGHVTYIDNSKKEVGKIYNTNGTEQDSMTGIQLGMTYKF